MNNDDGLRRATIAILDEKSVDHVSRKPKRHDAAEEEVRNDDGRAQWRALIDEFD